MKCPHHGLELITYGGPTPTQLFKCPQCIYTIDDREYRQADPAGHQAASAAQAQRSSEAREQWAKDNGHESWDDAKRASS